MFRVFPQRQGQLLTKTVSIDCVKKLLGVLDSGVSKTKGKVGGCFH